MGLQIDECRRGAVNKNMEARLFQSFLPLRLKLCVLLSCHPIVSISYLVNGDKLAQECRLVTAESLDFLPYMFMSNCSCMLRGIRNAIICYSIFVNLNYWIILVKDFFLVFFYFSTQKRLFVLKHFDFNFIYILVLYARLSKWPSNLT